MEDYLDLWIAGLLRRKSARLQKGLTIVGHREKHFEPRSEFARVVMTINPAEEFGVVDNVPCRKDLEALAARGRTTENAQAVTRRAAPERGCHLQARRAIGLPGEETARHPA